MVFFIVRFVFFKNGLYGIVLVNYIFYSDVSKIGEYLDVFFFIWKFG